MESNLHVLIVQNQAGDLVGDLYRLLVRHIIDRETVCSPAKDAFPARQRMCANQRMVALELEADIAGGAARAGEHLVGVGLSVLMEPLGVVGGCQGLKERFLRSGQAVVELVARGPQSILCSPTDGLAYYYNVVNRILRDV